MLSIALLALNNTNRTKLTLAQPSSMSLKYRQLLLNIAITQSFSSNLYCLCSYYTGSILNFTHSLKISESVSLIAASAFITS